MFSLRLKSLSSVSLIALAMAGVPHAALAGSYDATVKFNTGGVITNAVTATGLTVGTNPLLTGMGAGGGSFTATGTNNSVVTINGTFVGPSNGFGLYVYGNNSHGGADSYTPTTFTGSATGNGVGSGIFIDTTGAWNDFTLTAGGSATSGSSASSSALLIKAVGTSSMNAVIHGTVTGVGGGSAISDYSTGDSNISITSDGTITAASTGNAIQMISTYGNKDITLNISGGSVSATGTGSAIYLANYVNSGNTINISAGTISSASSAAAIDVSQTSFAPTTINVQGGTISGNNSDLGTAILLSWNNDIVNITGGTVTGRILTNSADYGIVNFAATNGFTTNGNIGQGISQLEKVTFTSGSTTLANRIYARTIEFNGGTVAIGAATINIVADTLKFAGGTLNLGTNTLSVGAAVLASATANSAINLTVGSASNGRIYSVGGLYNNLAAGGKTITITPTLSGFTMHSGDNKFVVIGGMSDTTNLLLASNVASGWNLIGSTTSGVDAYGNAYTGNNIILDYFLANASVVPTNLTRNQSSAVTAGMSSNAPSAISNALQALSTPTQYAQAGNSLHSEMNRGSIEGAMASVTGGMATIGQRQDFVRENTGRGFSSGEGVMGASAWVQGFGFAANQSARGESNGYNASSGGAAFGIDKEVMDHVRAGAAFIYAHTNIADTDAGAGNKTRIDSYQGSLYGSYNGEPWYVDGAVDFGFHKYNTTRVVSFSGFSDTAKGSHNGYQYTAKINGGYPLDADFMVVTPVMGLAYTHLDQDGYKEASSNGAALSVAGMSANSVKTTLGSKFSRNFEEDGNRYIPEVRAAWVHEYIGDAVTSNASFVNGGASFTTTEVKPALNAALIGAGLTFSTSDDVSITADYDAELKSGYVGHTGSLRVKVNF